MNLLPMFFKFVDNFATAWQSFWRRGCYTGQQFTLIFYVSHGFILPIGLAKLSN